MSTRVSGHYLFHEGAAFESVPRSDPKSYLDASLHWVGQGRRRHAVRRVRSNGVTGRGFAVCGGCGEHSPILDTAAQRRRWAGEHKAKMSGRSLLPMPKTGKAFATEYTISALPDPECTTCGPILQIKVIYRGRGLWSVNYHVAQLSRDGEWDWDGHRGQTDEWFSSHRFTLEEALALAKKNLPKIAVNGHSAEDVAALHNKHHTQEPPA